MTQQDIFNNMRHPLFFEKIESKRKLLAKYLVENKLDIPTLVDRLEQDDWTGKDEAIAKIHFLSGGIPHVPENLKKVMGELNPTISLSLHGPNIEKWQDILYGIH